MTAPLVPAITSWVNHLAKAQPEMDGRGRAALARSLAVSGPAPVVRP